METRRLLIAVALMIGVVALSNILFPPSPMPDPAPEGSAAGQIDERASDPAAAEENAAARGLRGDEPADADRQEVADQQEAAQGDGLAGLAALEQAAIEDSLRRALGLGDDEALPAEVAAVPTSESQIVTVRSGLYEYRFSQSGASLVGASLHDYPNFAGAADGGRTDLPPVELVRQSDHVFGYSVSIPGDTVRLADLVFTPSTRELEVGPDGGQLTFSAPLGAGRLSFDVNYGFRPDSYQVEVSGGLRGYERGYSVLIGLGRGIAMNEANEGEDRNQRAVVTRNRSGQILSERLGRVGPGGFFAMEGAPFSWVASKSKYWLAAFMAPGGSTLFGGVTLTHAPEPETSAMEVNLPVAAGEGGFDFVAYLGPQDFARLRAAGQDLENVNPYGWSWLRWFIRPFGSAVTEVLIWMRESFALGYGWVLVVFGVLVRIVMAPLMHVSLKQQVRQTRLQPEMQKIRKRYGDGSMFGGKMSNEERLKQQQEMRDLMREHKVNPALGCLPMMLPMPVLITMFFVFQNTIEFRGVSFMWIPDLSLADPLYILPVFMGVSMYLMQWIGQRGVEQMPQMKMMLYVMPVVMTVIFLQFAAGLNLYYATQNIAGLPQQLYLARERRQAREQTTKG